jgi:hypothetical protein
MTATAMNIDAVTTVPVENDPEVFAAAVGITHENNAIQIATLGGPWSPWILGAYFTAETAGGFDILVMVEKHGKSMKNLRVDKRIAFTINSGDATKDFMQGAGIAEVLDDAEAPAMVAALTKKMPWYQLYTPCAPVRIRVTEAFVTSFARGWLPARPLAFGI